MDIWPCKTCSLMDGIVHFDRPGLNTRSGCLSEPNVPRGRVPIRFLHIPRFVSGPKVSCLDVDASGTSQADVSVAISNDKSGSRVGSDELTLGPATMFPSLS
jgi:hypothetical protein